MIPADTVIEDLDRDRLPEVAQDLCGQGYRLVQMMGTPREDTIEVMVSFDKNYELKNYRVTVPRSDLTLPSITGATGSERSSTARPSPSPPT